MTNVVDLDETMSPSEAGRQLGVSADRARRLVDDGTLMRYRSPLGRLVPAGAVRDLIERARSAAAHLKQRA